MLTFVIFSKRKMSQTTQSKNFFNIIVKGLEFLNMISNFCTIFGLKKGETNTKGKNEDEIAIENKQIFQTLTMRDSLVDNKFISFLYNIFDERKFKFYSSSERSLIDVKIKTCKSNFEDYSLPSDGIMYFMVGNERKYFRIRNIECLQVNFSIDLFFELPDNFVVNYKRKLEEKKVHLLYNAKQGILEPEIHIIPPLIPEVNKIAQDGVIDFVKKRKQQIEDGLMNYIMIVGPTKSGKTKTSYFLAKELGYAHICFDRNIKGTELNIVSELPENVVCDFSDIGWRMVDINQLTGTIRERPNNGSYSLSMSDLRSLVENPRRKFLCVFSLNDEYMNFYRSITGFHQRINAIFDYTDKIDCKENLMLHSFVEMEEKVRKRNK